MIWILAKCSSANEELIAEAEIGEQHSDEIQQFFGTGDGFPVMSARVATQEQRTLVETLVGHSLDMEKFEYFLERIATRERESITTPNGEVWYLPPWDLPAFPDAKRTRRR